MTKNIYRGVFLGTFVVNRFVFAVRLLILFSFPNYKENACLKMVLWISRAILYVLACVTLALSFGWLNQFQRMWGIAELIAVGLEMPNEILLQGQVAELMELREKLDGGLSAGLDKLKNAIKHKNSQEDDKHEKLDDDTKEERLIDEERD